MLDRELLSELQLVLIEPADGGDTWPSLIWTRDEVLDAVNAGLRSLVHDTHLDVTRIELPDIVGGTPIPLPCDWLATASVVWRDAASARTPLGPADGFEGDLADPGWEGLASTPLAYLDRAGARQTLQLLPPAAEAGTVELLYIRVPEPVTGAAPGTVLPVADEFLGGVKYSALGTLLRKVGRLLDPERAAYCERRYELTSIVAEIILGGWG